MAKENSIIMETVTEKEEELPKTEEELKEKE